MSQSDQQACFCLWIEDSVTILLEGTVTCGLDDSDGLRAFDNINEQTLEEIFTNPEYARLAAGLAQGRSCEDCAFFQSLEGTRPERPRRPRKPAVEPTIRCNLRCPQIACHADNNAGHVTRETDDLSRALLDDVRCQLGSERGDV
ncbi:MAG: SPASM domain-containing protein [Rhodobacteraceae bacterium]|nr:SPASM domain-containing protein [Paracoccaceae bacterium]